MSEVPVIVRIYVIQGINLRSRDNSGYSDAFVKVQFGNEILSDRASTVSNQCNPIFGRRFQVTGVVPG